MKKSLLLLVAGAMAISANAQYARPSSMLLNHPEALNPKAPLGKKITPPAGAVGVPGHRSASRTTSITSCVYTETFPPGVFITGGSGGLADVWTTGTNAVVFGAPTGPTGLWHQSTMASTSGNSLGTLASTTGASNGWMIFDCDSVRGTSTTAVPGAWLQSPAINCTALTAVGLSFQELFMGGSQDTCVVEVSTSPTFSSAITYYPIPHNNLLAWDRTPNPDTILLDITTAAAGKTVYIRFVYQDQLYWGFSWLLDDMCVGALSAHDISVYHNFMYQPNGSATAGAAPASIYEIPLIFVDNMDSVAPVTTLTNLASSVETSVPVTANIYNGATSVYSETFTYGTLPIAAIDSIVQFPSFAPTAVGQYTCAFNAALTTDTDPANNVDTSTFDVDDTTWNDNYGQFISNYSYYVYADATIGGGTPVEEYWGARFDVSPNISVPGAGVYPSDTVSSFSVAFSGSSDPTNAGGTVMVQLYSRDPSTGVYSFMGESVPKALTTADYSTTSSVVYATFPTFTGYGPYTNSLVGGGNFVLDANTTYAAVVQTSGLTSTLLIMVTDVPAATYYNPSYIGQGYASSNDGTATFGSTDATGETFVPMISMNFGHIPNQNYRVGVQNVVADNFIGQPFPNPSNVSFTIPVTLAQDNKVTVTLMDMMGQVVNTQNVNATGGQPATAVFNTSNLAEGIYLYSVQANGVNTTGRVVVAH